MSFVLHPALAALGLRLPLAQAPTGSIAGPELCAAVTRAGALGGLGLTWTAPDHAYQTVSAVREAVGNLPFQANFALHFPPHALSAALDAGVPIVSLSWGDAEPWASKIKQAGAALMVQVTTNDGARRALDAGADLLVCQGIEAGGHVQSTGSLWDSLPRVLEAAGNTPVFAAGGIGDGATVARVLALGASGAMLGTRFVATRESRAHSVYKRALVAARGASDTALTLCFDGGWPFAAHRVLRNATLEGWEASGCPPPGSRPGEGDVMGWTVGGEAILRYEDTAPRDGMSGDALTEACLYAGTGVGAIHEADLPAAEVVRRLWNDCQRVQ